MATEQEIAAIDEKWLENMKIRPFLSPNFPLIVTLCGSTRFMEAFYASNMCETLAGRIVLTVGMSSHGDYKPTEEQKKALDRLHFRKIDLSDEILVLNVGGYIGESTRNEIAYAKKRGKVVHYLEKHPCGEVLSGFDQNHIEITPQKCILDQGHRGAHTSGKSTWGWDEE